MQKSKTLVGIIGSTLVGATALLSGCSNSDTQSSYDAKRYSHFPSSNILTTSAREYCESKGKKLSDYELIGVSSIRDDSIGGSSRKPDFPQNIEVIVDYSVSVAAGSGCVLVYKHGTALIPKQK